jgi:DNA-binding transcriptional ArsR family regulator
MPVMVFRGDRPRHDHLVTAQIHLDPATLQDLCSALPYRPPLRHPELTGSMSLRMVSHMPKFGSLDRTFGALADPTRRSILQLVSAGPASISELARPFGIALPTVLEHVRILEETRLLTTEKVGRVRECMLGPERLDQARQWIETFRMWERRLDVLDRYISTRMGRRA